MRFITPIGLHLRVMISTYTHQILQNISLIHKKAYSNKLVKIIQSDPKCLHSYIKRVVRIKKRCIIDLKGQVE